MCCDPWYNWGMGGIDFEGYCPKCKKDLGLHSECEHGLENWHMRSDQIDRSFVFPSNVLLVTKSGKQALFYEDIRKVLLDD